MTNERSNHKKKAILFLAGLCVLMALLAVFVYLYDKAAIFGSLQKSPMAGPLEIIIILIVLAMVGAGGSFGFYTMWKGQPKSFLYDLGLRLVITGYLMAFISAMADYFGIGAHHKLPYFGPLQAAGVYMGEAVIVAGFLMMFPYKIHKNEV